MAQFTMNRQLVIYLISWTVWLQLKYSDFSLYTSYLPSKEPLLLFTIVYLLVEVSREWTNKDHTDKVYGYLDKSSQLWIYTCVLNVALCNIPLVYFCLGPQTPDEMLLFIVCCHSANFILKYLETDDQRQEKQDLLYSHKPVDLLHHFFIYQLTVCIMNKQSIMILLLFQISMIGATLMKTWIRQHCIYNNPDLWANANAIIIGSNKKTYLKNGNVYTEYNNNNNNKLEINNVTEVEELIHQNPILKFYIPHYNIGIIGLASPTKVEDAEQLGGEKSPMREAFNKGSKLTDPETRIIIREFNTQSIKMVGMFYLPILLTSLLINVRMVFYYEAKNLWF
ncbi:Uncharacterised protein g1638 [Pycnogonum litorale]